MKKFFGILGGSVLTLALLLSSCGGGRTSDSDSTTPGTSTGSSDTGGGASSTPETPAVETHYSEDTREAIYTIYSEATGEAYGSYKSLYDAIAVCANDGDEEDYVTKGTKDDVKLFINYSAYSETSQDMFWYYENGTSLDRYTPWLNTYFADLYTASSQDIVVFKQASGTFSPYYQGTEVVGIGDGQDGTVATWNVYRNYDANVQVDMEAYSGIIKSAYTIDFTEASIRPTYEGEEPVYAKVGFIMPDSYIVASFGIYCDTTNGNWYYYYGDINTNADPNDGYDGSLGTVYTDEFVMSSTWDEEEGVWHPDHDIVMTGEIVTMGEGEDTYYVDRLTIADAETNEQIFTRDYEAAAMTACATVRFNVGLDIYNYDNDSLGLPNYDNGAEFTNIVITKAIGTVTEDSVDPDKYGGEMSTIETPGDYDLLNSSEVASEARYKTYIYNAGVVDYDFDTPGRDVYGFSFKLSQDNTEYSTTIGNVKNLIAAIPALDDLTTVDQEEEFVIPAREAYDTLVNPYQTQFITEAELKKLTEAEEKCLTFHVTENIAAVIEAANGLKSLGTGADQYNGIAAIVADADKIVAAYEAFMELDEESQNIVVSTEGVGTKIADVYAVYMGVKDLAADSNIYATADYAMKISSYSLGTADLYSLYKAYNACTTEELAALPAYISNILNGTAAQNGFKDMYATIRTHEIVSGWYEGLGIDDTKVSFTWTAETGTVSDQMEKDGYGWHFKASFFTMTDELFATIPEEELAELTALWTTTMMPGGNTWTYRNDWGPFATLATDKGWHKQFCAIDTGVIFAVLDFKADDDYAYDMGTGMISSTIGNAINSAATNIWAQYVDDETFEYTDANGTIVYVCTLDASVRITALKTAYDAMNPAQKEAFEIFDEGRTTWAIAHRDGEYAKMDQVAEMVAALDSESDTFEADVAAIVEVFNTFDPATSFFFRDSASQWIPADGIFESGKYVEAWTALQAAVEGLYELDGSYFVEVTEEEPAA